MGQSCLHAMQRTLFRKHSARHIDNMQASSIGKLLVDECTDWMGRHAHQALGNGRPLKVAWGNLQRIMNIRAPAYQ